MAEHLRSESDSKNLRTSVAHPNMLIGVFHAKHDIFISPKTKRVNFKFFAFIRIIPGLQFFSLITSSEVHIYEEGTDCTLWQRLCTIALI